MKKFLNFIIFKLQTILKLKIVYLCPKGVFLNENNVFDSDLNVKIKINSTAYSILELLNNELSFNEIITILLNKYSVHRNLLEKDVLNLFNDLEEKNLFERKVKGNKIITYFFNVFIGQYIYKKRYTIPKSNIYTFLLLLYLILKKLFLVILFSIIITIYFKKNFIININIINNYYIFIFSIILGFVIHEWVHIFISRLKFKKVHGYIMLKKFTISIVKLNSESTFKSILLGPVIPSFLGIIFIISYFVYNNITFLFIGLAFVINIINLLPFASDGKRLLEKFLIMNLRKE